MRFLFGFIILLEILKMIPSVKNLKYLSQNLVNFNIQGVFWNPQDVQISKLSLDLKFEQDLQEILKVFLVRSYPCEHCKVVQEIRRDIILIWAFNSAWLAGVSSSNVSSNFLNHFIIENIDNHDDDIIKPIAKSKQLRLLEITLMNFINFQVYSDFFLLCMYVGLVFVCICEL